MFYFKLNNETEFPVVETRILDHLQIIEDDKSKLIDYIDILTDDNLSACELLDENKNHVAYFENLHYSGTFTILKDCGLTIGKYSLIKLSDEEIKIRNLNLKLSDMEQNYNALNNAFIEFVLNSNALINTEIDTGDDKLSNTETTEEVLSNE